MTDGAKSVPYNFINVTPGTNQNLNMENTGTDAGTYEIIPFNDLYKTSDGTPDPGFCVGFGRGGRRKGRMRRTFGAGRAGNLLCAGD